jgi:hypothetical protein
MSERGPIDPVFSSIPCARQASHHLTLRSMSSLEDAELRTGLSVLAGDQDRPTTEQRIPHRHDERPSTGCSGDRLRHDRTTKKGKQRSQDPYETGIEKSGVMPVTSVDPGSPQSYVSPLRDSNPSDGDPTLRGRLYRGPIPSSPRLLTSGGWDRLP